MCAKIKRIKEFKTFGFQCVRKSKEFKTCDLFSYYRFKIESGKLKSYTLSFKKVLIRLEENDNNVSKTAKEFNIHRKNLQRWTQQKDVIFKAVTNRMVD